MLFWEIALAIITLVSPGFAAGGLDILSILNQQNGISSFVALLQQFPDLIDTLNNGTFSGTNPTSSVGREYADGRKFSSQMT